MNALLARAIARSGEGEAQAERRDSPELYACEEW